MEVYEMKNYFESFAQIGLPRDGRRHRASSKSSSQDLVCYMDGNEKICFRHEELAFAVLW